MTNLSNILAAYRKDVVKIPKFDENGTVIGGTIAVAETNIPELNQIKFYGASPKARQNIGEWIGGAIRSPGKIPSSTRHAEEDIVNQIDQAIQLHNLTENQLANCYVNIHVDQKVCTICKQGLNNPQSSPGVLKQFSQKYPQLTIKITAEGTPEVIIIKGGKPIK